MVRYVTVRYITVWSGINQNMCVNVTDRTLIRPLHSNIERNGTEWHDLSGGISGVHKTKKEQKLH